MTSVFIHYLVRGLLVKETPGRRQISTEEDRSGVFNLEFKIDSSERLKDAENIILKYERLNQGKDDTIREVVILNFQEV